MDLVTVTCGRDKKIMGLQSHSIDKFIAKPCTHWVLIEDNTMSIEEWQSYLQPHYTRHSLKLIKNFLPEEDCVDTVVAQGWHRQQILKFMIAD